MNACVLKVHGSNRGHVGVGLFCARAPFARTHSTHTGHVFALVTFRTTTNCVPLAKRALYAIVLGANAEHLRLIRRRRGER